MKNQRNTNNNKKIDKKDRNGNTAKNTNMIKSEKIRADNADDIYK